MTPLLFDLKRREQVAKGYKLQPVGIVKEVLDPDEVLWHAESPAKVEGFPDASEHFAASLDFRSCVWHSLLLMFSGIAKYHRRESSRARRTSSAVDQSFLQVETLTPFFKQAAKGFRRDFV